MSALQKHFLWRIAALRKFIIVSFRNLPVHHVLSRFLCSITTELMLQHLVKLGTPLAGVRFWRTNNALQRMYSTDMPLLRVILHPQ